MKEFTIELGKNICSLIAELLFHAIWLSIIVFGTWLFWHAVEIESISFLVVAVAYSIFCAALYKTAQKFGF